MKKMLFIGIFLCLMLIGCSQQTKSPNENLEENTIPVETTVETQPETTTEPTLPPVEGVEGTVLYNEDKFALVLTSLTASEEGQIMTVTAVNKTDIKVYMRLMNLAVNSYMFENLPMVELKPNQTLKTSYTLPAQELQYNNIQTITDLQFNLWVYDSMDFQTPDVADGLCIYYTNGKGAVVPMRQRQPEDQVLVDDQRFFVTVSQVEMGENVVLQMHLFNYSEKELLFIIPYSTVNEQIIDPLWAYNVSAGKQRNTQVIFPAKKLQEAGIEDVTQLLLPIQIGNHEDWSAGAYFYEVFDIDLPQPQQPEQEP